MENRRAVQGVLGLAKTYGDTRLEAACARALSFATPRYRSVKTILVKGLDQLGPARSRRQRSRDWR